MANAADDPQPAQLSRVMSAPASPHARMYWLGRTWGCRAQEMTTGTLADAAKRDAVCARPAAAEGTEAATGTATATATAIAAMPQSASAATLTRIGTG